MHHSPLLLSRVAESAYWAGRYLARAEGTARLIKTHGDLVIDLPREASVGWGPLLEVLGVDDTTLRARGTGLMTEETVVAALLADPANAGSVRASVAAVHRNLRVLRAVLPIEASEVLIELHHHVTETADAAVGRASRRTWLTTVIRSAQTLSAVLHETMTHDDAYGFFTIGRQLERAELTTRVLDVQRDVLMRRVRGPLEPYADLCWYAALRSVSALQPFRRTGVAPSAEATVEFLLRNPRAPQSVEFCMLEAARWLLEIPGHEEAMSACAALQARLQELDMARLVDGDVHREMDELQQGIAAIDTRITERWFAPEQAELRR